MLLDERSAFGDHRSSEVGDEFVVPFGIEKTSEGSLYRRPRDLSQFHQEGKFNIELFELTAVSIGSFWSSVSGGKAVPCFAAFDELGQRDCVLLLRQQQPSSANLP